MRDLIAGEVLNILRSDEIDARVAGCTKTSPGACHAAKRLHGYEGGSGMVYDGWVRVQESERVERLVPWLLG